MRLFRQFAFVRWFVLAIVAATLSGCNIVIGPDALGHERSRLDHNWRLWRNYGYSDYEYVVRNECYCQLGGVAVRVSVDNDRVVWVEFASSGVALPLEYWRHYGTVDDLFAVIDDALVEDAHQVDASYDSQLGYPYNVYIDYSRNSVDEEFGFRILDFYSLR